ncbi:class I SAM-dependent methyltransferase [Nocardioides sp. WS12]|uniref:class I SAM-dependent methyltransferase n=1 Tax=Nocardioides sp. WS12 TaxID=2486272 RepID=UPI0015FBA08C|nr:class I SAM-dependent methyltransferase [Nocardioides sp. WS12]
MATDSTPRTTAALSFGNVVEAYDRGQPGYPREAVAWLTGEQPRSILELGAGTGKLTEHLVALGHDVHATDPDPRMLERLADRIPELRVSQTNAEEIPAADATFDLVIAGNSYEWFNHELALPEIARVLRRGGSLAVVRNLRDERIPWVKRLGNLIGHHVAGLGIGDELDSSPYFGPVDEKAFKQWQVIQRASVQDLVRSLADVATLERTGQESRIREVLAFYDDFGRGMDGMQLPYVTECFRAVVGIQPKTIRTESGTTDALALARESDDQSVSVGAVAAAVEPPADDDSGMLLIDFR